MVLALALAGCGDDGDDGSSATTTPTTPITVDQLVARSADTPIAVTGLLYAQGGVTKLCAMVLESYPPQCGGASVVLTGIDVAERPGAQTAEGVSWEEGAVVTVQRQQDGTFAVLAT